MLLTSILLSALFAGIVATLVTIAIEKFGGRTGGVLATIPTTIVPAALGMYSISGETEFAQSMSIVPLGMMVNAIFLLVWIHAPQRFGLSLVGTTILSLIAWTLIGSLGLLISSELQASGVDALAYAFWIRAAHPPWCLDDVDFSSSSERKSNGSSIGACCARFCGCNSDRYRSMVLKPLVSICIRIG